MKEVKFSWRKRIESFRYAWQGIVTLLRDEHNARIHLGATVLVILFGIYFTLSTTEWIAIVGCIGAVFSAEALNSAIEAVCDHISLEQHPLIKKAKDCAAAAVLILAIAAATIGSIVFLPKLIALIG